jgi:hypothetical protein
MEQVLNVELMILSNGRLMAAVPAQLLDLSQAEFDNATVTRTNHDGSQSLPRSTSPARSMRWHLAVSRRRLPQHRRLAASEYLGTQPGRSSYTRRNSGFGHGCAWCWEGHSVTVSGAWQHVFNS